VSPSEIAFLALGLILGAAIGAAFVEALRARPAPRREVRITVSPNSIAPRRSATLAFLDETIERNPMPGSPEEGAWPEARPGPGAPATQPAPVTAGLGTGIRTRVPSSPVGVSSTAIGVPVSADAHASPYGVHHLVSRQDPGPGVASATLARSRTAGAVLDPIAPTSRYRRVADARLGDLRPVTIPDPRPPAPEALPATLDVGAPAPDRVVVRTRPPAMLARPALPSTVMALDIVPAAAAGDPSADANPAAQGRAAGDPGDPGTPGDPDAPGAPAPAGACQVERRLVEERCALAAAARDQARLAADALRDAQRTYDVLRERVERAQVVADPREIRAAKDAFHREFRAARAAARTAEATEGAARDWLTEINRLNTAAREAAHIVETGTAELRAQLPRLERLAVEADAARISAEGAEVGCHEARVALAECEERATLAVTAATRSAAPPPPAEEPALVAEGWPTEEDMPLRSAVEAAEQGIVELAVIVRILRGDRPARERLVASLAGGDGDTGRQWQIRIAGLVDAIGARAIEDGYLDLPDEGFWGLFTHRERREIVTALSALGYRFDGLGGFADGRVPAQRDLSLAVGYAGLDRMRIRNWPRESELAGLYAGAAVAADEWLADEAGDLSLGRMVDALGSRAAELADVWNAWGRVRPALLASD
jgi:hypothetical protein